MLGYTDPSARRRRVRRRRAGFRSGDLGTLDERRVTSPITGRLKDVIIRKGENISAKEVEDLLFTTRRSPTSP